jgi:predicted Zn finger-like uncharacterized protein
LFTQCSNCHTVFQLSADVLRAAGGQVRCGRCGEIFNALARLAEDANSFDTGESAYDMEERADSILESVVAEQVARAMPDVPDEEDFDGSQVAQLQVIDFTEEDLIDEAPEESADSEPSNYPDAAMEFTLPPGELDRIFVGSAPPAHPLEYDSARMSAGAKPAPPPQPQPPAPPPPPPPPPPAPETPAEDEGPLPDIEVISDDRSSAPSPLGELARPSGSFALWWSAAIVSALLLVGQVVHRNREALIAQGPLAPALRMLYSSIGAPLNGAVNLGVYQLRQWGVTGDPAAGVPGAGATLRVRASILNTSAQLQPFPLLRLTLANRYGTRIGARDFEPGEYMGKPIVRSLSPGEKVDAMLNIIDPGKDAEGFEIDVCLRGADKKITCANDVAQAKP